MRKSIIFSVFLLFLVASTSYAQKESPFTYYYDTEDAHVDFKNFIIDSNTKSLVITGVNSRETLKEIFLNVIKKDNIEKIEFNAYSGKLIPANILAFKNLNNLSVNSSPTLNLKKLFRQLHELKYFATLSLDDNESAEIPSNIKTLESLQNLSITNYDMVDANKLFVSLTWLPKLQNLRLASCVNVLMDRNVVFPKSLQSLDLSDNWLSYLPAEIAKASQLHALDITENSFDDADPVLNLIENLPLKTLKISCQDKRDSLIFTRAFPAMNLELSIYHDLKNTNFTHKSTKEPSVPIVDNFYSKTVKPTVGDPEIVRKKYVVEAEQPRKLYYPSGTTFEIPQQAFVDASGKPITGNVDIYYREFKDIIDIFANGVPMGYDSAGQKYAFKTAGMFEMYAVKDNEQVFLAPDKKISFELAALDTAQGYNLYRLNEKTGNWNLNAPLRRNSISREGRYSLAYKLYTQLMRTDLDTTSFEDRYADSSYARTFKIPFEYFNGKKRLLNPYFKLKRMYKYSLDKDIKKLPNFMFDLMNYSTYREQATYRGYVWAYSGNLTKKDFSKKYISRKKWTDLRISYMPTENVFSIELKSPSEVVSMQAYPIKPSFTTDTKKYQKTYTKLDYRYNKALKKCRVKFDKRIEKTYAGYLKRAWNEIYKTMSPAEKAMSREEWMDYARKRMALEKDSLNQLAMSSDNITRSFEIDGFGIWNCDQILRMKNPIEFLASFKDAFNNKINTAEVNVIDGKIKGILSYSNLNFIKQKIAMDPTSETAMFIIKENGEFAFVDKNTVKNTVSATDAKGDYTFTAYEIDPMLLSTGELRKKLGFE